MQVMHSSGDHQQRERLGSADVILPEPVTAASLTWDDVDVDADVSSPTEAPDSCEALKNLRRSVLGSIHGSKRHARKCMLFDVPPGEGVPKDPAELAKRRLEVLGARLGTPPRHRDMEVLVDLDLPPGGGKQQELGRNEISRKAPAVESCLAQQRGAHHGRRVSCPGNTFTPSMLPPGSPRAVQHSSSNIRSLYPKAQSCSSKLPSANHEHRHSLSDLATEGVHSYTSSVHHTWPHGDRSYSVVEPTNDRRHPVGAVSPSASSATQPRASKAVEPREVWGARGVQGSPRQGRLPPKHGRRVPAVMMMSQVAQSEPVLSATSLEEEAGFPQDSRGFSGIDGTSFDSPPPLAWRGDSAPRGVKPGAAGAEGGDATGSSSSAGKGLGIQKSMTWGRLIRHMSMDVSTFGGAALARRHPQSPGRRGPRRAGFKVLGARMVPDKKAQEYYSRDP